MSIFSRFADIINSNMNALLEKAEDPKKLIRMIIQEMEDTLVEVRTESASVLAEKKEHKRHLDWFEAEINDWQAKAELALAKQRDDLAKAALVEKHKLERSRDQLKSQVDALNEALNRLTDEINQLQEKLHDARARQQALQTRYTTQQSRVKVSRKLYADNNADVVEKFEQIERKLDAMEAESEVLASSRNQSLKSQFDELETNDQVDEELASLKEKLNKTEHNKVSK